MVTPINTKLEDTLCSIWTTVAPISHNIGMQYRVTEYIAQGTPRYEHWMPITTDFSLPIIYNISEAVREDRKE